MPTALHVVLKFVWYIISRLLVWALAIGLVVLTFFMAMDYMNVRILVQDSMKLRAEVIIEGDDPTTLSQVFSKGFLEEDDMLDSDTYQQYIISDFDYNIDVGFALIFPWQNTVTLKVTEEILSIDGEIYANTDSHLSETPPVWDNAIYDMTLVRYEDNWRIVSMELTEQLPDPTPLPTESPTASPTVSPTEPAEVIED
ncbi:MAG: hypothetical protein PHO15_09120 [Eubacteriales bacterium]|nr:hypothetical protein [Eubacteriales bacterium]